MPTTPSESDRCATRIKAKKGRYGRAPGEGDEDSCLDPEGLVHGQRVALADAVERQRLRDFSVEKAGDATRRERGTPDTCSATSNTSAAYQPSESVGRSWPSFHARPCSCLTICPSRKRTLRGSALAQLVPVSDGRTWRPCFRHQEYSSGRKPGRMRPPGSRRSSISIQSRVSPVTVHLAATNFLSACAVTGDPGKATTSSEVSEPPSGGFHLMPRSRRVTRRAALDDVSSLLRREVDLVTERAVVVHEVPHVDELLIGHVCDLEAAVCVGGQRVDERVAQRFNQHAVDQAERAREWVLDCLGRVRDLLILVSLDVLGPQPQLREADAVGRALALVDDPRNDLQVSEQYDADEKRSDQRTHDYGEDHGGVEALAHVPLVVDARPR
eukprot:3735194-Prymnesium_polylepis.2